LTEADAALLRRSAAGDHAAFEAFVERHQDAVYRYLVLFTGEAVDAEDALQDAFIAAWHGAGTFRGEGAARAWLLAIARHAAGRRRRRRVQEPASFVSLEQLGLDAGWGESWEALPDSADDRGALLTAALERLRPEEREVIVLRDLEGFSGEETAALLGLTLQAMKTRLHRARLQLAAEVRRDHG
jgi:RNA polymerase sigma-70 factor (ECF subfamily)